jgi:hypothetical protein
MAADVVAAEVARLQSGCRTTSTEVLREVHATAGGSSTS